jgi:hypothetical protein
MGGGRATVIGNQNHTPHRLADGPRASVDHCTCGSLHIHVGAVTLRVSVETLGELTAVLAQARAALVSVQRRESIH